MTSTDLAQQADTHLDVRIRAAQAMASGGEVLPRQYRDNPAALLVGFEYADALGLPRIQVFTSIHIVDGKPSASAELIAALVRRAGHKLRVLATDERAEVTIIRADDPEHTPPPVVWDEAKARRAGLWGKKGPWQTYPGAMLRSRAVTEAARSYAPEALFGVSYTPEELESIDRAESGAPAYVDAAVVTTNIAPETPAASTVQQDAPKRALPTDLADKIAAATDAEWLGKTWDYLAHFEQDWPTEVGELRHQIDARLAAVAEALVSEVVDAEVVEDDQ